MGLLRLCIGLLLVPLCIACTRTVSALVVQAQPAGDWMIPPTALAIGGGYFLWIFVFFTLPRPVRTYVLAHELTHALWAAMMGARVSKLKITKTGGSVTVSKNNFLITLAPYFFPLYTAIVLVIYGVLAVFYPVEDYFLLALGLVGFTWGFHFTFTVTTLLQHQSDIQEYGRVFSYAIIYLFNIVGIGIWIVVVSSPTIGDFVHYVVDFTLDAERRVLALLAMAKDHWPENLTFGQ